MQRYSAIALATLLFCASQSSPQYTTQKATRADSIIAHHRTEYRPDILEKLCSLSTLRPLEDNHLHDWAYLLERGAAPENLTRLSESTITSIVKDFRSGIYNDGLISYLSADPASRSWEAAQRAQGYDRGVEWLRCSLQERLLRREHVNRAGARYREDSQQLGRVTSARQLALVQRYMDFFDDKRTWAQLRTLFPKLESDEAGGVMLDAQSALAFIPIQQRATGKERTNYSTPDIIPYLAIIGNLHIHPFSCDAPRNSFAGPSGYSYKHNGNEYLISGDFKSLKYITEINPYTMDSVVTELERGRYNVDLYFYPFGENGRTRLDPIVLDIGVFCPK
jgi:hypothetical protein